MLAHGVLFSTITVWDTATGDVQRAEGDGSSVISVSWRPGGRLLAVCAEAGAVRVWDVASDTIVQDSRLELLVHLCSH